MERVCYTLSGFRNRGSALIMVILLIVLLVSMAVTFLSMVGRQRGSSAYTFAQVHANLALEQAQNHVIKTMVESADDASLNYHTLFNPSWRIEFAAVTDPDGDPYTEDGTPRRAGSDGTLSPSTWKVSTNGLVNSSRSLFDMVGMSTQYLYSSMFTLGINNERHASKGYTSRWYNIAYIDDYYKQLAMSDSMSESERRDVRLQAKYVVRYMAHVMDLNGMQCINNNYPNAPIYPGDGTYSDLDYVRYQNYLREYGRSIKSQMSCYQRTSGFGQQRRSNDPDFMSVDPLDREVCNTFANGSYVSPGKYGYQLNADGRLRAERAFRGDMQWADTYRVGGTHGGEVDKFGSLNKSRIYTWGQIQQAFIGNDVRDTYPYDVCSFAPYGESLDYFENQYAAPSPWHVNLLTCSNNVFARMIMGMHSELKYTRLVGENATGRNKDKAAQADLFGRNYPEPFPMDIDAGRAVPLVGEGYIDPAGKRYYFDHMDGFEGFPGFRASGGDVITPAANGWKGVKATRYYENSYMMDIAMACCLAVKSIRRAWIEDRDLPVGSESVSPASDPRVFRYKNGVNNSYIDRSVNDPDEMIKLVLREIYRILGEGYIDTSVSPATSHNYYDTTKPGLLAGGESYVGKGSFGFSQRLAQLPYTANTRAMEYALNDFMISLFGKANPDYQTGDPRDSSKNTAPISEDIAIDFNNDGAAESTVTGWIDTSAPFATKQRIWSYWFNGLGPYVNVKYPYMKEPGWYRFKDNGDILRKDGANWILLSSEENSLFRDYNTLWLTGNNSFPLKAISRTGRFFIGKSKILQGFLRAEFYDLIEGKVIASSNRSFVYKIDPDNDSDYRDSHVVQQQNFEMK